MVRKKPSTTSNPLIKNLSFVCLVGVAVAIGVVPGVVSHEEDQAHVPAEGVEVIGETSKHKEGDEGRGKLGPTKI